MEKISRSKKILKPDVPPPKNGESDDGLIILALGLCGVVGVIAIILMVI